MNLSELYDAMESANAAVVAAMDAEVAAMMAGKRRATLDKLAAETERLQIIADDAELALSRARRGLPL